MKVKSLSEIRKSRKITQLELAEMLGVSPQYISYIETGKRNPSDKLKKALAKALKVEAVEIFLATNQT